MREITQGQIDRYVRRAQSFGTSKYFEWAATMPEYLGRRAMLKALRDYMGPSRRAMQRAANRRVALRTSYIGGRP